MNKNLGKQLSEALKAGKSTRVSVLRMLIAAVHNAEIEKRGGLSEPEFVSVVRKELKKREEAIEAYQKGNRPDRAQQEKLEAEILKDFLPQQLSDQELDTIVDQVKEKLSR